MSQPCTPRNFLTWGSARWWVAGVAALCVLATVWVATHPELRQRHLQMSSPSPAPTSSPPGTGVTGRLSQGLGAYAAAIRTESGEIDIESTVQRLKAVGADHYYYLIWDRVHPGEPPAGSEVSVTEWRQLPAFASRAEQAGIEVTVYLVPPSESSAAGYRPFGWDYVAWFKAIGEVAAQHRNIRNIAIDDFAANTVGRVHDANHQPFEPEGVRQMVAAARAAAPWIRFYAVMYSQDLVSPTGVLPQYRNSIDGIIFAFAGPQQFLHAPQNTTDARGAATEGRRAHLLTSCHDSQECLQLTLPKPKVRVALPQSVVMQRFVELPAGVSRLLSLSVLDDRSRGAVGGYSLTATIEGRAVPLKRTQGGDWSQYRGTVPDGVTGRVELKVVMQARYGSRGFSAFVDDVVVSGTGPRSQVPATGWTVTGSGGASAEVVREIDLVYLVYCARLGIESGIDGAASASYVEAVTRQIEPLVRSGDIDGVVAYRLNLSGARTQDLLGAPASFEVVRQAYARYRAAG